MVRRSIWGGPNGFINWNENMWQLSMNWLWCPEVCKWLLCAIEHIPSLCSQKLSFPVMNPAQPSWLTMVDHMVDFSLDIWVQKCGHDHGHWQPCIKPTFKITDEIRRRRSCPRSCRRCSSSGSTRPSGGPGSTPSPSTTSGTSTGRTGIRIA